MNKVAHTAHRHFIPSHHNSYRPHVLRTGWLLFFVMLIVVSEGMFVSGVFVQQSNIASAASIQNSQTAAVAAAPVSFLNAFGRQLGRMAVNSEPVVPWMLGLIGLLVTIAVLLAFFVHIQIQQSELLFSGVLVAMFAFSLMVTNIHILGIL